MDHMILVDADSIYFRIACVVSKDQKLVRSWKKDIRTAIDSTMNDIGRQCLMGQQLVALKGRGNFRKDLYPDYKATRPELDDARKEALNYGYTYMKEKYDGKPADGMEADDLVSIWASEARDSGINYFVVGIDKDLLQIPGNHYNFTKREHRFMDDDEADLCLMLQCLTGDTSDNIPGIRGIGPKRAATLLANIPMGRRWSRVRAAWRANKAGSPELSRRLLTMLTSWKEYEDIREQLESKTPVSEPNVRSEREEDIQKP